MQGGAFRLPNGNTIITDCDDGYIFEVTNNHNVVWDHRSAGEQSFIARAQKYPYSYLGLDYVSRGDIDYDGRVNIIDAIMLLDMINGYGYAFNPPSDYDANGYTDEDDFGLLIEFLIAN